MLYISICLINGSPSRLHMNIVVERLVEMDLNQSIQDFRFSSSPSPHLQNSMPMASFMLPNHQQTSKVRFYQLLAFSHQLSTVLGCHLPFLLFFVFLKYAELS